MTEITVFILSLGLLHVVWRLNKLEEKLNKRLCTASKVYIHVGNLSPGEVEKFVDDVVRQMKKEQKHGRD